jgi:SPX domain protein involved in polyphosphate accumulation
MKFGKKLELNAKPEWRTQYLDYKALKELIKASVEESQSAGVLSYSPRTTSLTVIRANKNVSAADKFFTLLESEVRCPTRMRIDSPLAQTS